jgi:hypothetical protein
MHLALLVAYWGADAAVLSVPTREYFTSHTSHLDLRYFLFLTHHLRIH